MNALHSALSKIGQSFEEKRQHKETRDDAFAEALKASETEYLARHKRLSGRKFVVINTHTLECVGTPHGLTYDYAKHVRDIRDFENKGNFMVKEVFAV